MLGQDWLGLVGNTSTRVTSGARQSRQSRELQQFSGTTTATNTTATPTTITTAKKQQKKTKKNSTRSPLLEHTSASMSHAGEELPDASATSSDYDPESSRRETESIPSAYRTSKETKRGLKKIFEDDEDYGELDEDLLAAEAQSM